jgi:NAD(P)-dependent dehydrogenase (short-subunit alcohol dehydrogenase family)
MEFGLAGKTALVTGGSKGIGLETARALAREGVKVLICARREAGFVSSLRAISVEVCNVSGSDASKTRT